MEVKIQVGTALGPELMFIVRGGVNTGIRIGVEVSVRNRFKARITPGVRVKVKVEVEVEPGGGAERQVNPICPRQDGS